MLAAIGFSLLASALGIWAIFPRSIQYATVREVRTEGFRRSSAAAAQWWLVDDRVRQYEEGAARLKRRGVILRFGFIALGVGIFATFAAALIAYFGGG